MKTIPPTVSHENGGAVWCAKAEVANAMARRERAIIIAVKILQIEEARLNPGT
jgi:hypothetical protein